MQNFAKSTFQSLHVDEIAGAKFGDYGKLSTPLTF